MQGQEHYCMHYVITRCRQLYWSIFNLQFQSRLPNSKFNSPSNILAIWYFCLTNEIITVICMDMKLGLCQCPNELLRGSDWFERGPHMHV